MIVKEPIGIDVSRYRVIADFAALNPRPYLIITKATEGLSYVDPTFVPHMTGIHAEGYHGGCYHFFRKAYDPIKQAQHFCNTIRPYVTKKDLLILDVEEGGETAAQLQKFLAELLRQFPAPDNMVLLYSNKVTLDPIPMTAVEKTFFRQINIWAAGYPANPDLYPVIPEGYKPTRDKYGPTIMWQYADNGLINGVLPPSVDCNLLAPELITYLGATIPPPEPPTGATMSSYFVKATMNIRANHSTSSADIGDVLVDSVVTGDVVTVTATDRWLKLSQIWRNGVVLDLPASVCYVSLNTSNTVLLPAATGGAVDLSKIQNVPATLTLKTEDGQVRLMVGELR